MISTKHTHDSVNKAIKDEELPADIERQLGDQLAKLASMIKTTKKYLDGVDGNRFREASRPAYASLQKRMPVANKTLSELKHLLDFKKDFNGVVITLDGLNKHMEAAATRQQDSFIYTAVHKFRLHVHRDL